MRKIKVSIVIPTYNRETIIRETLDSAINQEFGDFEIVVVDNCSTDGTYDILKEYQEKYKNMRIYQNEENIGPVRNWKKAIELARGEYVKILWSDDQIDRKFLKETVPILETDKSIGFVYTKVMIYNEKSKNIVYSRKQSGKIKMLEFIKGSIGYSDEKVPVSPGCALFRKKDLEKNLIIDIPGAENPYGAGNDLLLFLLCYKEYEYFYYLDKVYSYFRAHKNSFSIANKLDSYYENSLVYFFNIFKSMESIKKIRDMYFTLMRFKKNSNLRERLTNEKYNINFKLITYIRLQRIIKKIKRIKNKYLSFFYNGERNNEKKMAK